MSFISSIFHRKQPPERPQQGPNAMIDPQISSQPQENSPTFSASQQQPSSGATGPQTTKPLPSAPHFVPGTGPQASAQMRQANMIGMAGGAIIGAETGGDPVMGMVAGQVGANLIMQRIHQEQKSQYYREQAMRYRAGLPADGVEGDSPRDERRRKRWERRAKRRDGGSIF